MRPWLSAFVLAVGCGGAPAKPVESAKVSTTETAPTEAPAPKPIRVAESALDVLAVGGDDTCVRPEKGAVRCWGRNLENEASSSEPLSRPREAKDLDLAAGISLGAYHACLHGDGG